MFNICCNWLILNKKAAPKRAASKQNENMDVDYTRFLTFRTTKIIKNSQKTTPDQNKIC